MKLVVAIVQDYDASNMLKALIEHGYRVTHIGNTGGFMRTGNSAIMVGVHDEQVRRVTTIISRLCRERREEVQDDQLAALDEVLPTDPIFVSVGGASIFVVNVARFERIEA